jgi:hypothetical protein
VYVNVNWYRLTSQGALWVERDTKQGSEDSPVACPRERWTRWTRFVLNAGYFLNVRLVREFLNKIKNPSNASRLERNLRFAFRLRVHPGDRCVRGVFESYPLPSSVTVQFEALHSNGL